MAKTPKFPKKQSLIFEMVTGKIHLRKIITFPVYQNKKTSMKIKIKIKGENQNRIQNLNKRQSRKNVYEVGIPE